MTEPTIEHTTHRGDRSSAGAAPDDIDERSRIRTIHAATKLRNALRLNAVFSTITGLVSAVFGGWVAARLGLGDEHTLTIRLLGAGLLMFAATLVFVAGMATERLIPIALEISIADLGWVVMSAVLIAIGTFSTGGAVIVGVVAVIVFDLAVLQLVARSRCRRAIPPAASESRPA